MDKLYEIAHEIMQDLINNCDPKLKQLIHRKANDIRISAPVVFIEILTKYHETIFGGNVDDGDDNVYYDGIEVIPNYEMAVVLFHVDYPKVLEQWMIKKVLLSSAPNIGIQSHLVGK